MISALDALARLRDGNRRFVVDVKSRETLPSRARRIELAAGQEPFAAILGCSDSRVPVEIVFDQGLGDLFVIRVAGNIVAPSLVGSVEFAASEFGTRLVVVMGHTQCGAVAATMNALTLGGGPASRNLRSIVDRIAPHVQPLLDAPGESDRGLGAAVRANAIASARELRHASSALQDLVDRGRVAIVSAVYDLETGLVTFHDEA